MAASSSESNQDFITSRYSPRISSEESFRKVRQKHIVEKLAYYPTDFEEVLEKLQKGEQGFLEETFRENWEHFLTHLRRSSLLSEDLEIEASNIAQKIKNSREPLIEAVRSFLKKFPLQKSQKTSKKSCGILPWIYVNGKWFIITQVSFSSLLLTMKTDPLRGNPERADGNDPWVTATRECFEESMELFDFSKITKDYAWEMRTNKGHLYNLRIGFTCSDHLEQFLIDYDTNASKLVREKFDSRETEGLALEPVDCRSPPIRRAAQVKDILKKVRPPTTDPILMGRYVDAKGKVTYSPVLDSGFELAFPKQRSNGPVYPRPSKSSYIPPHRRRRKEVK